MTYFYKKRQKVGLTRSEMANQLGMAYDRYESIERGEIKMPTNLMDKFNEIINKGKINDIERLNREKEVEEWWLQMVSDKNTFKQKMKEFNISTYDELGVLLGYKNGTSICTYINQSRPCSFDFKNKLYSFFENELNIQKPKTAPKTTPKIQTDIKEYEEVTWYKNFDIKNWLRENGLQASEFALRIGMPDSTFYYYVNPRENSIPRIETIRKVRDAIMQYENNKIISQDQEDINGSEDNCKDKIINIYNQKIEELEGNINELQNKIDIYKELIKTIEEI